MIRSNPVPKPEFSVLCIGLLASGKSTILAQLSGEQWENIPSTLGTSQHAHVDCHANASNDMSALTAYEDYVTLKTDFHNYM